MGQAKQQGGNLWMIFDSMLCFALPMKVEERAWGRLLVGRMVEEGKLWKQEIRNHRKNVGTDKIFICANPILSWW